MAAIQARNFQSNSLSGVVSVTNGFANLALLTNPFALEGNKSFVIKLRRGSILGDVVATSPAITLQDNSSFVSLTANTSSVNEGNLVQFTLVTANAINGSTLFYSVSPVTGNLTISDFYNSSNTGYITLNNNQATFALYANTDSGYVDETGETFRVQIRSDSITGNVVYASTSNVVITDFYKSYNILGFTESSSTVAEGGAITLTFTADNVPAGTILHYSTDGNTTSSTFASANTGSFVMNAQSNTISLVTASVPYGITQNFNVKIREGSPTGAVVATSNNIIVVDSAIVNMTATGGNVITTGGYRIHTFNTSSVLNITNLGAGGSFALMDILSVGGGGSGSGHPGNSEGGGGGGAGGYVYVPAVSAFLGNLTVTLGAGGAYGGVSNANNGSNTSVTGPNFSNILSVGGGFGGNPITAAKSGGSGGGSSTATTSQGRGYGFPSPTQQGYPGGGNGANPGYHGGGGGAGGKGANAISGTASGAGGIGIQSNISGISVYYAGGGGGGTTPNFGNNTAGAGGLGGGGRGSVSGNVNTGGGGGGGLGPSPASAGAGGSGIVIIRYPYVTPLAISNVLVTPSAYIVGSNITFTVNATNANLTTLYYTTDGNVDSSYFIGGNTGSFVANASGGIVTLLGNTNATVPVGETRNFRLQIRQDSITGFISSSSSNVALLNSADFYINASGGNVVLSNGYKIHTFETSSNLTVTSIGGTGAIEYLVIAGGGAGGGYYGGGGGAGGVLMGNTVISSTGNITLIVGGGGSAAYERGSNSSISINQIVSSGGGGSQGPGGSGGGGSGGDNYAGGLGTTGQGNPGGTTAWSSAPTGSGGGGGAGQAGAAGGLASGKSLGGNGISVSWVTPSYGTAGPTPGRWFGGGGGGGLFAGGGVSGGVGGGGPGGPGSSVGVNGTAFTGGGGGGRPGTASPVSGPAGLGGSGIIFIRYPYGLPYFTGLTVSSLSSNVITVGSNVTFDLAVQGANTRTLYYSTEGNVTASNFIGGNTGSFVANTTGAVITLQANTNIPLDESRYFALQIRQDSTSGSISATSANITINAYASQISATGGTITTAGGYRTHTFTDSANLIVTKIPQVQGNVEILLVAGGGGPGGYVPGSSRASGGGGGGGVLYRANATLSAQQYSIVVGGGGGGGQYTGGTNGTNSTGFSVIASGGGFGGSPGQISGSPNSGGTGGNGGGISGDGGSAGGTDQGSFAGWFKYGNPGGGSSGGSAGLTSNISGTSIAYGNGGGVNQYGPATPTYPGTGAGGIGTRTDYGPQQGFATAASPGIVIIRYPYV